MLSQEHLPGIIKEVLSNRTPVPVEDQASSYTHAAVLIPLFERGCEYEVLFTERTNRVEHHKGQISCPGGVVDEDDGSYEETVLREAYEEIGLLRKDVTILGQIDDTLTVVSNFVVHPFVGLIPYPYHFRINSEEVQRIIHVPLRVFMPDNPRYKGDYFEYEGVTHSTPTYTYQGDTIWGATARIMENFVDILGEKIGLLVEKE